MKSDGDRVGYKVAANVVGDLVLEAVGATAETKEKASVGSRVGSRVGTSVITDFEETGRPCRYDIELSEFFWLTQLKKPELKALDDILTLVRVGLEYRLERSIDSREDDWGVRIAVTVTVGDRVEDPRGERGSVRERDTAGEI